MCYIKKLLSIIMFVILVSSGFKARALASETYEYNHMEYTISANNEITITDVSVGGKHIIPSEINGFPVTCIGKYAFSNTSVEEVFIPNSVVTIEYGAFYACSELTSVTIENPVVYSANHMTGLNSIGERAFFGCEALEEIILPRTVSIIDKEAFSRCHSLRYVVLPYGVREIRDYAFSYCPQLSRLVIPESVYKLDISVYAYSGLVTSDASSASCLYYGGEGLVFTDNHELGIKFYNYKDNYCYQNYEYPELWEFLVEPQQYSSGIVSRVCCCGENKTLSVPKLSDSIWKKTYTAPTCAADGRETYSSSYGIITNILPATGKHTWGEPVIIEAENAAKDYIYTCSICNEKLIERKWAFEYAIVDSKLKTIQITGLKDSSAYNGILRIPSEIDGYKVTEILEIPEISHVTKIEIGEGVEKIHSGAFSDALNIQSITLSDTVTCIFDNAFENCISLEEINIPKSLVFLGTEAFKNCSKLKYVDIPGSVESVPESSFYGCDALESAVLNEGTISLGIGAFASCENLKKVSLPSSLKSIKSNAFCGCESLKELNIPEGVTDIGSLSFTGSGIEYFRLPSSITEFSVLPGYIFSGCSSCRGVYADEESIGFSSDVNGVLYNKDKSRLLYYPAGSPMTEYCIPDGVTEICTGAFGGESGTKPVHYLEKISLPKTLQRVGAAAFWACSSLDTVVYDGTEDDYSRISVASYGNENLNNAEKVFTNQNIKEIKLIDNSTLHITLASPQAVTGTVYVALYNKSNALIELNSYPASENVYSALQKINSAEYVKVMWWDLSVRPVCELKCLEL